MNFKNIRSSLRLGSVLLRKNIILGWVKWVTKIIWKLQFQFAILTWFRRKVFTKVWNLMVFGEVMVKGTINNLIWILITMVFLRQWKLWVRKGEKLLPMVIHQMSQNLIWFQTKLDILKCKKQIWIYNWWESGFKCRNTRLFLFNCQKET